MQTGNSIWPPLSFTRFKDTLNTVQLWVQIVGKIRLRAMPWINHSWHVTLYVSARGLTTGSMPYQDGLFEIEFNFIDHVLHIRTSAGASREVRLYPRTVADFYHELFAVLSNMGVNITIHATPNELDPAIPFASDDIHASYDPVEMNTYWRAMVKVEAVFTCFRARFKGKCSPVHLFWGAFDLAVTRFSGREAPLHGGGMVNMPDRVMQEAYSHEVSSAGFWPGSEAAPAAAFYSYCYPTPATFGEQPVQPKEAFYSVEMGEFFLPYEAVRTAANPSQMLMDFLLSTYEAAATTGDWNRHSLECDYSSFEK